jgi:hypothetical protein
LIDYDTSTDFLGMSNILREARIPRECFDPKNTAHLKSLKMFLDTGNWGEIQFYAEAPYVTVPETVLRKVAQAALKGECATIE